MFWNYVMLAYGISATFLIILIVRITLRNLNIKQKIKQFENDRTEI